MNYARPPITEAVIEFQFAGECGESERAKVARKLKTRYPVAESRQEITFESGSSGANQHVKTVGLKLSSDDRTEIITLSDPRSSPVGLPIVIEKYGAFSASQLAPYCGWASFSSRFAEDWSIVEKIIGWRKLQRIGVRFINRIDIPGEISDPRRWVSIEPALPAQFPRPTSFNMRTVIPVDSAQANLLVGTAPSPLPRHSAILLDIDIYTVSSIGDQAGERLEILKYFHDKKNWIFESCITDDTRRLFK
ncbi:TIGR04255 family protein [Komagataeibacter saccharivorans]|uniref:TIGR04255 family protein n=1 Tax=Komagataeibacter saccharivorans TaxID=265959 RepID=UPI0024A85612|nr:TIGR04255 family protein [Komagataeibacter saccharivorans]